METDQTQTNPLENLYNHTSRLSLPSTLWATHAHPKYQYVAICLLKIESFTKIGIEKAVLFTLDQSDSKSIVTSFFINGQLVTVPVYNRIDNVSDFPEVIQFLHNLQLCLNYDREAEGCRKYIDLLVSGEYCEVCRKRAADEHLNYSFNETSHHDTIITHNSNTSESLNSNDNSDTETNEYFGGSKERKEDKSDNNGYTICDEILTSSSIELLATSLEADVTKAVTSTEEGNEKRQKQFECGVCGKVFNKSYNFQLHLQSHSGLWFNSM